MPFKSDPRPRDLSTSATTLLRVAASEKEMLPDYPKVKGRLAEVFHEKITMVQNLHMGTFSQVPACLMHEGETNALLREDGSVQDSTPQQISASWELPGEFEKLTPADVDKLLHQLGEGLAKEKWRVIMKTLDEAFTRTGNVTDPSKSPVEQFLEGTEMRQIEFHEDGRPMETQFLVGSEDTAEALCRIMRQIEATPELRNRYEAIIERKRREWRDREAARKLVD